MGGCGGAKTGKGTAKGKGKGGTEKNSNEAGSVMTVAKVAKLLGRLEAKVEAIGKRPQQAKPAAAAVAALVARSAGLARVARATGASSRATSATNVA